MGIGSIIATVIVVVDQMKPRASVLQTSVSRAGRYDDKPYDDKLKLVGLLI